MITAAGRRVALAAGRFMYNGGGQQAADRFNLDHIWAAVGLICVAGFQCFSKRGILIILPGHKRTAGGTTGAQEVTASFLFVFLK